VAAPVARAVAEDLEAIFPNAVLLPSRRMRLRRGPDGDLSPDAKGGGERRTAVIGAIVAAAFVGVSAGVLLPHSRAPATPVEATASLPNPAPSALAPLQAAAPSLTRAPYLVPTPVASPSPPQVASVRKAPMHRATAHKASAHMAPAHRISVHKVSAHKVSAHKVSAHKVSAHKVSGSKASRATTRTRAVRTPSIMTADAQLRHAYAAAVRAGVSRQVLVDYRNAWERLRWRAPREPGLVAARYVEMAARLDRLAEHRHVAQAAPRGAGMHHGRRVQLAAR
jgi:hypothetical protein